MKIISVIILSFGLQSYSQAQNLLDSIKEEEAYNIINVLASDSLRGRGNGSADLLKACLFIGGKFKEYGLTSLPGTPGYYMPFRPFGGPTRPVFDILKWNDELVPPGRFLYLHAEPGNYGFKNLSDFTVIRIDSCFSESILNRYTKLNSNILLWTPEKQPDGENFFPETIKFPPAGLRHDFLLVCSPTPPDSLLLAGVPASYSSLEYNVIGILPGKSKPSEIIVFSAHYDHEGVYGNNRKDSIMNGANDDASGVTAMMLLANYFSLRNDNERTLLFCAFAGEELGLLGSTSFVRYLNPENIIAGINIEMIGVPQYGKNKVFILGKDISTLPALLTPGLEKMGLKIRSEPSLEKMLFQRSDNYPFAAKGIPAHTIMSSDDDEPCYHKLCDEIKRINISHLTNITRAIAFAAEGLISGKETPTRIKVRDLR